MEPALREGDWLFVLPPRRRPRVGEVVVLRDPRDTNRLLLKRVAAVRDADVTVMGDRETTRPIAATSVTCPHRHRRSCRIPLQADRTRGSSAKLGMADVTCARCGQTRASAAACCRRAIGDEIEQRVCAQCWTEWLAQQIRVINHYGLRPALREDREKLYDFTRDFLGLEPAKQG